MRERCFLLKTNWNHTFSGASSGTTVASFLHFVASVVASVN